MSVSRLLSTVRGLPQAKRSMLSTARDLIKIEAIEARAEARIERINKEKERQIGELRRKILLRAEKLFAFFTMRKMDLPHTESGTTAKIDVGSCEWYPGASSIEVSDEEAAIKALQAGVLRRHFGVRLR